MGQLYPGFGDECFSTLITGDDFELFNFARLFRHLNCSLVSLGSVTDGAVHSETILI